MKNIILFGPPGSGKGTQSKLISQKYRLKHTSTGDMLRSEISQHTDLGMQAQRFMSLGELVPDTLVVAMLRKHIETHRASVDGFLFDGYPRTILQADILDQLLAEINAPISLVIFLRTEKEELVRRIVQRGMETGGRADDNNPEVIEYRLQVYAEQTLPLKAYYAKKNLLVEVDGMNPIEEVFVDIENILDSH